MGLSAGIYADHDRKKPFPSPKGCDFFYLLELSLSVRENYECILSNIMCKKSGPLKEEGMHAGAMADKFAFANLLRKTQTPQEEKLWEFLKIKPQGFKFRRQHPFKDYILDFYCHRAQLVIELDGQQHKSNLEYDRDRTSIIESYGLKVIRFENYEIDNNFDKAKEKLMNFLKVDDNFPSL